MTPLRTASAVASLAMLVVVMTMGADRAAAQLTSISRLPPVVEVYPEDLPRDPAAHNPVPVVPDRTTVAPSVGPAAPILSAEPGDAATPRLGDDSPDAVRLALYPAQSNDILQSPDESVAMEPEIPVDRRSGVFQKVLFDATWMPRIGARGFGESDLELKSVWGLPFPTADTPLVLTPGFAVRYLDGPAGVDMPPRLYDSYLSIRWLGKLSSQWGFDMAITPGWFSDFEQGDDAALRLPGYGALAWNCTRRLTFVFGVSYLDREDVDILPIGGMLWNPNDDWKFELLFPKPRIARRVTTASPLLNYWLYAAAEFGGGTWAIASQNGGSDLITLRDYRLLMGIERDTILGLDGRIEVGYVLGRQISFLSGQPDYEPSDTLLLRVGASY